MARGVRSQFVMVVLRRLAIFWVLLGVLLGGVSSKLISWVDQLDRKTWARYEQPLWSEDEAQVAYLRYEIDPKDPQAPIKNKELWVVSRVAGEPRKIADLGEQDLNLQGWVDDDKRLLLMPRKAQAGVPRVWTVSVEDGVLRETRFSRKDIELVSVNGGDVFFRRQGKKQAWEVPSVAPDEGAPSATPTPTPSASGTPTPTLTRDQLELLMWAPGRNSIAPVCSLPLEGDEIQIEDAVPSPDDHWVALVLKVDQERALWLYSRKDDKLRYENIKVNARALRLAWSWDSTGLVAAAEHESGCDLYVSWNIEKSEFTVLRANTPGRSFTPFWPRGEKQFLLLDHGDILRFDPSNLRAESVMGKTFQGKRTEDSSISPRGGWVVFRSREGHDDKLFYVSLTVKKLQTLLKPSAQTVEKQSLYYIVGDGLRQARQFWLGRSPLPPPDE